jgi:hypothetical protein
MRPITGVGCCARAASGHSQPPAGQRNEIARFHSIISLSAGGSVKYKKEGMPADATVSRPATVSAMTGIKAEWPPESRPNIP